MGVWRSGTPQAHLVAPSPPASLLEPRGLTALRRPTSPALQLWNRFHNLTTPKGVA